jgi:hypothetical protein
MDAHGCVRYIAVMQLLSGKAAAEHISGILHAKYQVHGYSVHLTAHKISCMNSTGQIDFGGGEYVAAGRTEMTPMQIRPEDNYLWWTLAHGGYFVQCNETLHLATDEIAMIEPEDRLLRAGGWLVPLFMRGHVEPIEFLIEVVATQLRMKENARIARVRIFRIDATNATGPRKSNPKKTKTVRKKR